MYRDQPPKLAHDLGARRHVGPSASARGASVQVPLVGRHSELVVGARSLGLLGHCHRPSLVSASPEGAMLRVQSARDGTGEARIIRGPQADPSQIHDDRSSQAGKAVLLTDGERGGAAKGAARMGEDGEDGQ